MGRRALWIFGAIVGLSACGPPRYFAAEYVYLRKDLLPPVEAEELDEDALNTLARAKTVAFASPSACADIVAGGNRSLERDDLLYTECGALMSELEAAAKSAGFKVISWKALGEPAQQFAKERGVELLLEVNRFAIHRMRKDMYAKGHVVFFEELRDGSRSGIVVEDVQAVGERCKENAPTPQPKDEYAVVLDIKLIDAASGQLLSRQVHMLGTREQSWIVETRYFRAGKKTKPGRVLCKGEPKKAPFDKDKPQHKQSGDEPKMRGSSYSLGAVATTTVGDMRALLVRRTALEFISALVGLRNIYGPPSEKTTGKKEKGKGKGKGKKGAEATAAAGGGAALKPEEKRRLANLFRRATQLVERHKPDQAEPLLHQILERVPDAPTPHYYLGRAAAQKGRCDVAAEEFKRYLASSKKVGDFSRLAEEGLARCGATVR